MTIVEAVTALEHDIGSMEKLAAAVKVSWHAVYAWKNGRRTPGRIHRGELAKLAERRELPRAVAAAFQADDDRPAAG